MKKIYFLVLMLGVWMAGTAQSFTVTPSTTVNSTVGASSSRDIYIHFTNVTQTPITLVWVEQTANYPSQWFMTVCDNQSCYTLPHARDTMAACSPGDSAFLKLTCTPMEMAGSGVVTYYVYDLNNPSSNTEVNFNINVLSTGVADGSFQEKFTISPNPAHDVLHLSARTGLLEKGEVALYDLRGQVVHRQKVAAVHAAEIAVGDLAPGIYFLRYDSPAGKMSQKFVVTH